MARHLIDSVKQDSYAMKVGIESGDSILTINDTEIEDIFDYQYNCENETVKIRILKKSGEEKTYVIEKEEDEDIGLVFDNGLMDDYRSCHNKCIFCFIDQMPKGMRETLYFKDDDSRLSFLQGNYVTLTNMSDHDLDRIIHYRLSPINVSFQTMNPELRCMMLNNRFAGEALKKADRLFEAGITMNGQIVLCKGVNDGKELIYSIEQLMKYMPVLQSVSVVPVGLSKYREGLYPLEPFQKSDAESVLDIIEKYQEQCMIRHGIHFVHASDEWYLLAQRPLPEEDQYDGYLQLENGVGMLRLLQNEFDQTLNKLNRHRKFELFRTYLSWKSKKRHLSIATGKLAYPILCELSRKLEKWIPGLEVSVYAIRNDFFGEMITVSGLVVGQDLTAQLMDKNLGECLLIPQNMLKATEPVFLDDMALSEVQTALQVPVNIVKSSGQFLVEEILGRKVK